MLPVRPVKTKSKLPASQQAGSEKKAKLKSFVSILNSLIWVHPRTAVPIKLFLWGGALPQTVPFGHT